MLKRWQRLSSQILHQNPWWTYRLDTFAIPGGVCGEYHYIERRGSAMVVPVLDDGRLILVNQYRYLFDRESLEFPSGGGEPGQSQADTARAELQEEAGFLAAELQEAGEFAPYNGLADEICKVFIARGLEKTSAQADDTEEFELVICSPQELDQLIAERTIWDGMTMAAWLLARPVIFSGAS
jgi:ADP-ribose pyrophosphatase